MPILDNDDCEWIVEKSKEQIRNKDKHAARAWIITAKSIFPYRFIVQYEAFKLHLACEEYLGAAQTLIELCSRFSREERLQQLVIELVEAISNRNGCGYLSSDSLIEKQQLKKVFDLLPSSSQKMILLSVADATSDPLQKGIITVAALRLFPETAVTIGLDMYDMLTQTFSRSSIPAANNKQRELLVTELIPILATSPCIIVDEPLLRTSGQTVALKTSHICQWLEIAASFYTTLTVQQVLCRNSHPCAGKAGWESLHKVFLSVAEKCSWVDVLHNKQIGPRLPTKVRWIGLQNISGYNQLRVPFEVPRNVAIACFYISVFLFFEAAWNYYSHFYQMSEDGGAKCWALIEEQSTQKLADTNEKPPAKKRKIDDNEGLTFTSLNLQAGSKQGDVNVIENFIVAIDCWNFLHTSNTYRGEFSRLCQQWGAVDWNWISAFKIDMALYKGDIELFRKLLQIERQKLKGSDKEKVENLRLLLQLVNAYLLLGDAKSACNLATELIALVPEDIPNETEQSHTVKSAVPNSGTASGRSLKLVSCSATDVIPYTLDIILSAVKEKVFSDSCTDTAIGQLIVLSQYNWPKEMECFSSVLSLIQKRGSFTYQKFFDYVITIEMLEEMMYLINQTNIKLNLISQENSSRTRAVTRGVNSKVREELVIVMDKQLERWNENIDSVIRVFFKQEKLCFIGGDE